MSHPVVPFRLLLFLLTALAGLPGLVAPAAAQNNPTYALSLSTYLLTEEDAETSITVTATLASGTAPSTATTVTLALTGTATVGASNDYTYTAPVSTFSIAANAKSATATIKIDPHTDTSYAEGDETIIVGATATGLTLSSATLRLRDGPFVTFPKAVYTNIYYPSASVSITVDAATGAVGTVTYSMTKTEDVAAAPDLTFTAATRVLAGTAHSTTARTLYTITATDDMGTTTGNNPTADDKTATTIVSVIVVLNQCGTPTGWHPAGVTNPSAGLIKDCNILLDARDSFDTSKYSLNWATTTAMTDWTDIGITASRVSSVHFDPTEEEAANGVLTGPLPPALSGLTEATRLQFQYQTLTGAVPPELGSLTKLVTLVLIHGSLSGAIPPALGELTTLMTLDLGKNQLSGPIPEELGQLTALTTLRLGENALTGAIPWELGTLTKLEMLHLNNNALSGTIPNFSELSKLKQFYLDGSTLKLTAGPIPAWLHVDHLPDLEWLGLGFTNRTGPIPDLSGLSKLKFLHLNNNWNLTAGDIPAWINSTNFPNLEHLGLSDTNRTGAIPDLSSLFKLEHLDLNGNPKLTAGPIPTWLTAANFPYLELLGLSNTNRNGTIPDLSSLSTLKYLALGNRYIGNPKLTAGPIPNWLNSTNFPNLETLSLSNTNRNGSIPTGLSTLSTLQTLGLYKNPKLTAASIPAWLNSTNFPNLEHLGLSDTNRVGAIPAALGTLSTLYILALNDNPNLTAGPIPAWINSTNFPNLTDLDLRRANRNGPIPAALQSLSTLRILLLGGNSAMTAGPIPTWLNSTTFPKLFWVALFGTNRIGTVPDLTTLSTVHSLILHTNQLTGPLPIPADLNKLPNFRAFRMDYNDSLCLPTGLDGEWFDKLTLAFRDPVEPHCAYSQPKAPTLTSGASSLTLNWEAYTSSHTDDSNDPSPTFTVSDYEVQYRAGATGQWQTVPHVANTHPTTSTTYRITGLTPGVSYQARYRARASHATDANRFYGTRWSPPGVIAPGVSLIVSDISATGAKLSVEDWFQDWWYKSTETNAQCSTKQSSTATPTLSLTAKTTYTYKVYSDSMCTASKALAERTFTTLNPGLTAGSITRTGATLTLTDWPRNWGYKTASGECTAVTNATSPDTATLSSLTAGTSYTYTAYRDTSCTTGKDLVSVTFKTNPPLQDAGDITRTGATLTLQDWNQNWWYKKTSPTPAGSCTEVTNTSDMSTVTLSSLLADTSYTYKIYRASGCDAANELSTVSFTTDFPTLEASDIGATSAKLTIGDWGTARPWYHKTGSNCATVNAGTETTTLSSLTAKTLYTYTAYRNSGCNTGDELATESFTTLPPTLTASAITATSATLTLSNWTTAWSWKGTHSGATCKVGGSNNPNGLTGSTTYTYNAYSGGTCAGTALTLESFTTLPPALEASAVSATSATLTLTGWTQDWWYKENGTCNNTKVDKDSSGTTTKSLTTLTGKTDYTYKAYSATNCAGTELATTSFKTLPPTLKASAVTATTATLTLTGWTGDWWYKENGTCTNTKVAKDSSGTTTKSLTTLTGSTDYTYTAHSATSCGGKTLATESFTTLPPTLKAGAITATTATLTLTNWTGDWWYKENGTCTNTKVAKDSSGTTTKSLTTLTGKTDYTYKAYSKTNCAGIELATASFKTLPPTLASSAIKPTSATLTLTGWNKDWWYKEASGTCTEVDNDTSPDTVALTGLTINTDYTYTAYSKTGCNTADKLTAESFATTDSTLTASAITATSATLTIGNWTEAWWYKETNGTCTEVKAVSNVIPRTVDLSSLTGSTDYTYTAYSKTNCADADKLATETFTTLPPTLKAGAITATTATLTLTNWTGDWWYKENGTCTNTKVAKDSSGTTTKSLTTLTGKTDYTYKAYSATDCAGIELATASFKTLPPTLASSDIKPTSATLTLTGWNKDWWYKEASGTCTEVDNDTSPDTVNLSSLTGNTDYTYTAYSATSCGGTTLATETFTTLPATLEASAITATGATLTLTGWTQDWWYKEANGTCKEVDNNTSPDSVDLDDLTVNTDYTYTAYSKTNCASTDKLATEKFRTTPAGLDARKITRTGAELVLTGWSKDWWYKEASGSCSSDKVSAGTDKKSLTDLTAGTEYSYTAHSANDCGSGTDLATKTFTTLPPILTAEDIKPTSAKLTIDDWGDRAWYYQGEQAGTQCRTVTAGTTSPTITETLTAKTQYTYTAYSKTGCAGADALATEKFTTLPPTLTAENLTTTAADLVISNWTEKWWYQKKDDTTNCTEGGTTSDSKRAELSDLTPGEDYTYTAYRASGCNTGDDLAVQQFTTLTTTLAYEKVTQTSADLVLSGWETADQWWYKDDQADAQCTSAPVDPQNTDEYLLTAPLRNLTPGKKYTYTAYRAEDCEGRAKLAEVEFSTESPPPQIGGGGGGGGGGADSEPAPVRGWLESPGNNTIVSGVDIIRGWSFSEARGVGIEQVVLYLNNRREAVIPCCSARPDVAAQHPDFPAANSGHSGWGITYNWGNLPAGRHTIQVAATATDDGRWVSDLHAVTVLKPGGFDFADRFSLAEAEARLTGGQLVLTGVVVRDKATQQEREVEARYVWQTGAQGLRLVSSRTLATAGVRPVGITRWLARLLRWGRQALRPASVTASENLTTFYEAPGNRERVAGVGVIRGWAFSANTDDRIAPTTVLIDNTNTEIAPCCSTRPDVAAVFPTQPNAAQSGWGMVYNYGRLSEGTHTFTAQITTESGDAAPPETRAVTVSRLGGYEFVDRFDLSLAEVELVGEEIILSGVEVRDSATQQTQEIEVRLQWSSAAQALAIVDTETTP